MASDVRVVEDGLDRRPPQRRVTSPWVWLVTGIAIGLGFGLIVVTPSTPETEKQPPAAAATPIAPVESVDEPEGIADVIPGFADALVAVAEGESQSLSHLLWPTAQPQVMRPLPVGGSGPVTFDVSGVFLASGARLPDAEGMVLSMGRPSGMKPFASNVTSFSWHDDKSSKLAYTRLVDGDVQLFVVGQNRQTVLVATGLGLGSEVAAWGDWGWAVSNQGGTVTLLAPNGLPGAVHEWVVLDSSPVGLIVLEDGALKLVAHDGAEKIVAFSLDSIGGAGSAKLSPDSTHVVVAGGAGFKVLNVDGDGETIHVPITPGPAQLAWSSDSRFVVFPWLRGIIVIDTVDVGRTYEELTSLQIRAVGVIALSDS